MAERTKARVTPRVKASCTAAGMRWNRQETRGQLVYEPVKAAITNRGKVFLQVDPDIYGKVKNVMNEAIDRIDALHAGAEVDWAKVRRVVRE